MAAPDNAITLREESKTWVNHSEEDDAELDSSVSCMCGWKGSLLDLLCDPEDTSEAANNFWCPRCRARGWSFD